VILAEDDARSTPGLLNASNNRTVIDDLDDQREATFLLGVNVGCTVFPSTTITFEIVGTRTGSDATVEATAKLPLSGAVSAVPEVNIESLAMTVDGDTRIGTMTVHYRNAPSACGWQLLVTFGDAANGLPGVPGDAMAIESMRGPKGTTATAINGTVSILAPAATNGDTEGSIQLTVLFAEGRLGPDASIDAVIVEAFPMP
jgi:hypothetical protein